MSIRKTIFEKVGTKIADVDRNKMNKLGTSITNTNRVEELGTSIVNADRNVANNLGRADADVDGADNLGISIANVNKYRIDNPGTSTADAVQAKKPGTGIASNATHVSFFFLHRAFFCYNFFFQIRDHKIFMAS